MVNIKEQGLLIYITEHCKRIEEKIEGISKEEFIVNIDIQEIICFNILQIGELTKKFNRAFLKQYTDIHWKSIIGMRNIVVHGYGKINLDKVWNTATIDVKQLKSFCEFVLKDLP